MLVAVEKVASVVEKLKVCNYCRIIMRKEEMHLYKIVMRINFEGLNGRDRFKELSIEEVMREC